ncbi:hypothetical protein [Helicobacter bizzozeronii]|nr:hypothetical protein [Helicobacter bizzozeronii]
MPIKRSTTLGGLMHFVNATHSLGFWYLVAHTTIKMLAHFAMLRIAH